MHGREWSHLEVVALLGFMRVQDGCGSLLVKATVTQPRGSSLSALGVCGFAQEIVLVC